MLKEMAPDNDGYRGPRSRLFRVPDHAPTIGRRYFNINRASAAGDRVIS
jgi:hypothetical protein